MIWCIIGILVGSVVFSIICNTIYVKRLHAELDKQLLLLLTKD